MSATAGRGGCSIKARQACKYASTVQAARALAKTNLEAYEEADRKARELAAKLGVEYGMQRK